MNAFKCFKVYTENFWKQPKINCKWKNIIRGQFFFKRFFSLSKLCFFSRFTPTWFIQKPTSSNFAEKSSNFFNVLLFFKFLTGNDSEFVLNIFKSEKFYSLHQKCIFSLNLYGIIRITNASLYFTRFWKNFLIIVDIFMPKANSATFPKGMLCVVGKK